MAADTPRPKLLIEWVRPADVAQREAEGWTRCKGPVVNPWAVMMVKERLSLKAMSRAIRKGVAEGFARWDEK